jgi:hypothetical protein
MSRRLQQLFRRYRDCTSGNLSTALTMDVEMKQADMEADDIDALNHLEAR